LRVAPWKDLGVHNKVLGLHKTPWTYLGPYNVALGAPGRRGRPDSGEAGGGGSGGRVSGGKGSRRCIGLI
jgi:hypothetical protein